MGLLGCYGFKTRKNEIFEFASEQAQLRFRQHQVAWQVDVVPRAFVLIVSSLGARGKNRFQSRFSNLLESKVSAKLKFLTCSGMKFVVLRGFWLNVISLGARIEKPRDIELYGILEGNL